MRCIDCHTPPTGWGWAAKALDVKAPDPFIRSAPGGEPVAAPTLAQTKGRNVALPTPGKKKGAPNAIHDRTMPDAYPEAQQTSNKGSKGSNPKDVDLKKKGKRADFRISDGEASPSPGSLGPPVEGPLQLTSLISEGDSYRKVRSPPYQPVPAKFAKTAHGTPSKVPYGQSSR